MKRKCWGGGEIEELSTIKLSKRLISSVTFLPIILMLSPVLYFTFDELINQLLSRMNLQVKAYFKVDIHSLTDLLTDLLTYLARQATDH